MKTTPRDPRTVSAGHFVGLKFSEGWWFLQVLGTSYLELKPWVMLNENGDRDVIASQTTGNQDDILDEQSRDQIEPDDSERGTVNQIMFGIHPSRVQLLPFFGREQNLGLEKDIEGGEDEVWVDGYDSPYNNPSTRSEIFYLNDMAPLRLAAHNPMDVATEARLSIHINNIHYATVTDVSKMKDMLEGKIVSKTHHLGLGSTRKDQIDTPEWVERSFGEHIKTTQEILSEEGSSGGNGGGGGLDISQGTELEGVERT